MTHHILGHENRDVAFTVVYAERHSDHFRRYRRAARPGLDRGRFLTGFGDPRESALDAQIDERPFFK